MELDEGAGAEVEVGVPREKEEIEVQEEIEIGTGIEIGIGIEIETIEIGAQEGIEIENIGIEIDITEIAALQGERVPSKRIFLRQLWLVLLDSAQILVKKILRMFLVNTGLLIMWI